MPNSPTTGIKATVELGNVTVDPVPVCKVPFLLNFSSPASRSIINCITVPAGSVIEPCRDPFSINVCPKVEASFIP